MRTITQHLKALGYSVVSDSYYDFIGRMYTWYKGKVADFHTYSQYNGRKAIKRDRASLGMAKTVAEDWASLCLNEKLEINTDVDLVTAELQRVLDNNDFRVRANQLCELVFALGTGAFVEYLDGGEVLIDYVRADMIYPLKWENGKIVECAFASEHSENGKAFVYLNVHHLDGGQYVVDNYYFRRSGETLSPAELPEGVLPSYSTGSDTPLFQVIRPNVVNNVAPDCPLGLSVYANAIDAFKQADLVFDSYANEFRLGRKRIVVPYTMAQAITEDDGTTRPLFDDNDVEFYALNFGEGQEPKLTEINMELRSDAHELALKTALNICSAKCGLGNDRYSFEAGNVKTATEVISEKSELYQHLRKHKLGIASALKDLCFAIARLSGINTEFTPTVTFDDSIIEDTDKEKQTFLQEIRDGVRQKYEYRMRFFGEDEATAKGMIQEEPPDNALLGFGG